MTKRRLLALVVSLVLVMSAYAAIGEAKKPVVGVLQLVQHVALDAAYEGFVKGLAAEGFVDGETVTIVYRNAQGTQDMLSSISDRFIADRVDLVLAIATPAAQSIAGKTTDIPILATAVTDFVTAGLAESNEKPGYNVSGTTDMNPVADQIKLIKELKPDVKTIGLMYTAGEDNSVLQARMAREAIEALGLTWVEVTVANSNDVQQSALSIAGRCDALYVPTDNVMATSMPLIGEVMVQHKIPVICGERGAVESGGMATLGIDYGKLGEQTGRMAARVLRGEDVSTMPIEAQTMFEYAFNKPLCDAIGLAIPEKWLPFAFGE